MAKKMLIYNMSEPLNGITNSKVAIDTGTGNLTIDGLDSAEQVLANGTLEYLENQNLPECSLETNNSQATLTLKAKGAIKSGFRFPWAACNGATDWNIHINPNLPTEVFAHSGGGNVKLNLAGMTVTSVAADSGGGNMEVVLPNNVGNLSVTARTGGGNVMVEIGNSTTASNSVDATSGAGNVEVRVPSGIAARIHASTGMGKVLVDSRFIPIDAKTYQSSDYDSAADKVEITAKSGAGNVSVNTK